MSTDADLQRDASAELEWEPGVGATDVAVAATGGVVRLTGRVPSYADRCQAERSSPDGGERGRVR